MPTVPSRTRSGRAGKSSWPGCPSTPSSSPRRARMPNDPRLERALEEYFFSERLARRRFVGRAGSTGLAVGGLSTLLAACGGVEGTAEQDEGEQEQEVAQVDHPKTEIG